MTGEGTVSTLEVPPLELDASTADLDSSTPPANDYPLAEKWPALVAGGVGLAGAAVWAVFGLQSMDAKSKADEVCDGPSCKTPEGVDFRRDAMQAGNVATVGMIVTGVGLASATVLWFALPFGDSEQVRSESAFAQQGRPLHLGVGPTGIRLEGTW